MLMLAMPEWLTEPLLIVLTAHAGGFLLLCLHSALANSRERVRTRELQRQEQTRLDTETRLARTCEQHLVAMRLLVAATHDQADAQHRLAVALKYRQDLAAQVPPPKFQLTTEPIRGFYCMHIRVTLLGEHDYKDSTFSSPLQLDVDKAALIAKYRAWLNHSIQS